MYLAGHVTSDDVKAEPWYYGHITRSDCDQILTEKGQDGDYIIRESETNVSTVYICDDSSFSKW